MPSWFTGDLRLVGEAILGALAFFAYTTITGMAGYFLNITVQLLMMRQWKRARMRALYSLTVAAGLAILVIVAFKAAHGFWDHLGAVSLALPYVLGFFGWFFVPGEYEPEEYEPEEKKSEEGK